MSSKHLLLFGPEIKMLASILLILFNFTPSISTQHLHPPVAAIQDVTPTLKKVVIPDLPIEHYQYWLRNHPLAREEFQKICMAKSANVNIVDLRQWNSLHANVSIESPQYKRDISYGKYVLEYICSRLELVTKSCWGYERNCHKIYLMPECLGSSLGQAKNDQHQMETWFSQADFGYVLGRMQEMEKFCMIDEQGNHSMNSLLECTKSFTTCRGKNLFLKIPNTLGISSTFKLDKNSVGGWNCDLQTKRIDEAAKNFGKLSVQDDLYSTQSWFNEFANYNKILKSKRESCDRIVNKTAILIKFDPSDDIYTQMSYFVNLYLTIHLNNRFSDDNQVIIWTNERSLKPGKFDLMWSVFSRNPPLTISQFAGEKICLNKFITVLLSKQKDSFYYDTPLISGCSKTGFMTAFNRHIMHKLKVPNYFQFRDNSLIRVTIFTTSLPSRKIINEIELIDSIRNVSLRHYPQIVDPDEMDLLSLINVVQNTDILVGTHRSALTTVLFLPDWASLFEINDSQSDKFKDLARLRGVSYFTFEDRSKLKIIVPNDDSKNLNHEHPHEKKFNYELEKKEFVSIILRATERVQKNRIKFIVTPIESSGGIVESEPQPIGEGTSAQQLQDQSEVPRDQIDRSNQNTHQEL